MSRSSVPSELLLSAFRYVAGELPPEEAVSFEARLATDPDACDALADAVRLCEAVAVAVRGRTDPRSRADAVRSRWTSRLRTIGRWTTLLAGLAALPLIAGAWLSERRAAQVTDAPADRLPRPPASSLLSLWHDLRARDAVTDDGDGHADHGDSTDFIDAGDVPLWMLTALTANLAADPAAPERADDLNDLNDLNDELNRNL